MNNNEQEKLQQLLQKYLVGELTPEEEAYVAEWYENLPGKVPLGQWQGPELEKQKSKNWAALNAKLQQVSQQELPESETNQKRFTIGRNHTYWLGIAASILLLIGFQLYPGWVIPEATVAFLEKQNNLKKAERISFSDGSIVWLEPGSQIQYPAQFTGATRDVYLNGKAFFSVARDKQHPFRVYGGAVEVKVLGTSFGVDFKTTEQVAEVLVRTGKVAVTSTGKNLVDYLPFMKSTKKTVQLQLNEKVSISAAHNTAVKQKISTNYWENQLPRLPLTFTDNSLAEVVRALEDQHRVSIKLENSRLKDCSLTAYFHNQPLPVKLEMICKSIGATYQVIEDKYLIVGEGCH
jgi:transmembrane sensor